MLCQGASATEDIAAGQGGTLERLQEAVQQVEGQLSPRRGTVQTPQLSQEIVFLCLEKPVWLGSGRP